MTRHPHHSGGGSTTHHDTDTPDATTQHPGGGSGGDLDVDTDHIDTMAGRLDSTGGRVESVGTMVGNVNVGQQSMGVVGSGFTGAAQTHLQATRQQVVRTRQAVQNAQAGTSSTARSYADTDTTNARNLSDLDTTTDVPRTNDPGQTTPGAAAPSGTATHTPPTTHDGGGPPARTDTQPPASISDRLGGGGDDGPPPDRTRPAGDDGGDRQPDGDPPRAQAGPQSLGRFDESRLTRGEDGRITHVDGVPVREKLRQLARDRAQTYYNEKKGLNPDGTPRPEGIDPNLSGGRTGNIVGHVMDTRTGEIFESTNGPKGSEIPQSEVHPDIRHRVDEMYRNGPYEVSGNAQTGRPHDDPPLRHAEVRATNQALHANPGSSIDDMIADTTFLRESGLKDAPFCANCASILHDVPSNSGRRVYDPNTGTVENRVE
jgi:uncharacterized protein YukE